MVAGGYPSGAFIWTESNGIQEVANLLDAAGVNLSGWTLSTVIDMSYDGKVLLGRGEHNGADDYWVAHPP